MDSHPKKFWSFIKSKHIDKCGIAPLKDEDGLTYSEPSAKAEILNTQFSSVFTCDDLSYNLPDKGPSPYDPMGRTTVTTNGVYKLLAGIEIHKATGPDGIPGRLLKELASELAPFFTTMYQASFDQGRVLLDWKIALVTPAFKKGNSNKAENYRPVSPTSICCKLAEHIIHSNAMRHLENLRILTDSQSGFVSIILVRLS